MVLTDVLCKAYAPVTTANAIAASQTPGAAGNLTLVGGAFTSTYGTKITITSAGNDSGRTFAVTGTYLNSNGTQTTGTVNITGPNITTVTSTQLWISITQIAVDAATAGAITVGVSATGAETIPALLISGSLHEIAIGGTFGGTSVQAYVYHNDPMAEWIAIGSAATSSTAFNVEIPAGRYIKLVLTGGTNPSINAKVTPINKVM